MGRVTTNSMPVSPSSVGAGLIWFAFAPRAETMVFVADTGQCIWDDYILRKHAIRLAVGYEMKFLDSVLQKSIVWLHDGNFWVRGRPASIAQKTLG